MTKLCPWSGMPCDCAAFPFTYEGVIPAICGERIVAEQPYIYSIRKLTGDQKNRAMAHIRKIEEELERERQKNG